MTALTATPQAATATTPPSMLLQVTAAPSPPAGAYSSNFTAGVDSWTNAGSATLTGNQTVAGTSTKALRIQGPTTTADATAARALTGLTVGTTYRYKGTFTIARGEVKLVAKDTASGTVLAQTSFVTYASPTNKTVSLSLDFVPTAAAVTIQVVIHQTTAGGGGLTTTADMYAYNITVIPLGTWLGTTIYRTDANGTDVVVREDPAGQDTSGGTMTVTDWEAALVGPVSYRVTDGNGAQATATATHGKRRRNYINDPRLVTATGWTGVGAGGAASAGATQAYSPNQTGAPGETWTVSIDITAPAGSALSGSVLVGWTAAALFGAFSPPTAFTIPAGQTRRISATGTMPAAHDGLRLLVDTGAAVMTGATLGRALMAKEADGGAYFDGTTRTPGAVNAWDGTADASTSSQYLEDPALGAWLTLPATATPSTGAAPKAVNLLMVLGYRASAETTGAMFQVIGRTDKIGNPGPLATRNSSLDVLTLDYASAKAVRDLLIKGDTAMLRQPTHPGMDMYLVASRVSEAWEDMQTKVRRWGVTIECDEVVSP